MTSVVGRWRIVETENWDQDALDLVAPAFIEFDEDGLGSLGFIAVEGSIDWREVLVVRGFRRRQATTGSALYREGFWSAAISSSTHPARPVRSSCFASASYTTRRWVTSASAYSSWRFVSGRRLQSVKRADLSISAWASLRASVS